MKQLTDEVFAQVRETVVNARNWLGATRMSVGGEDVAALWDRYTVLLAALDTAQPEQVNAMLVEALEKLLPMARRHGTLFSSSNPWTEACDIGDAALTAAKQAQPEPVNQVLLKALSAMLTHSGMDEDEWSKPTFDQARAAIMLATTKTQECGMCGYVGTKTDAVGQCPRCHWDELQAQPERGDA